MQLLMLLRMVLLFPADVTCKAIECVKWIVSNATVSDVTHDDCNFHIGQVVKVGLSCYLVLLLNDSKTR